MKSIYLVLFWDGILIGKVFENEKGLYRYYPNYDNVMYAADVLGMPTMSVVKPQLAWGNLPPFFKERVKNDPNLINGGKYATDKFYLKRGKTY